MSKAGKDLILCNVLCLQIPKALDMWPAGQWVLASGSNLKPRGAPSYDCNSCAHCLSIEHWSWHQAG